MAAFGSTGTSGGSGQVGNTIYQQLPPNYAQVSPMADPTFAGVANQVQSAIPTSVPGLESITAGAMASPLLQQILGPMLARLQAPQAQQRQNLTEATRAAGGLRGSTYGRDMNTLQQNQAQQGNDLMSQVLQSILAPLISGQLQSQQNQFLPATSLTNLLKTIAPSIVSGSTVSSTTGGSTGGVSDPFGILGGAAGRVSNSGPGTTNPYSGFYTGDAFTGGASTGVNAGGGQVAAPAPAPYIPYLDPFGGGVGGGSYDLGMGAGTQYLNSPATPPSTLAPITYPSPQPGEWW